MTFEEHLIKKGELVHPGGVTFMGFSDCENCGVNFPILHYPNRGYICSDCNSDPYTKSRKEWEKTLKIECPECGVDDFWDVDTKTRRNLKKDGISFYHEMPAARRNILMCIGCGTTYKLRDNKLIPYRG